MRRRRKAHWKKLDLERGRLQENFCWSGGLIFNRGVGDISKKEGGAWQEIGEDKIEMGGSCDHPRNHDSSMKYDRNSVMNTNIEKATTTTQITKSFQRCFATGQLVWYPKFLPQVKKVKNLKAILNSWQIFRDIFEK